MHGSSGEEGEIVHDLIKEFNATQRVTVWLVAHPQHTWSTRVRLCFNLFVWLT